MKSEKAEGCPECGNLDLIRDYEAGELVCESCGMVISSELFDHGPEWRAFNLEQREKRTRVGAPLTWTIHDKGLSTIIDWSGRDIYGRGLKPEQRAQAYRLSCPSHGYASTLLGLPDSRRLLKPLFTAMEHRSISFIKKKPYRRRTIRVQPFRQDDYDLDEVGEELENRGIAIDRLVFVQATGRRLATIMDPSGFLAQLVVIF